MTNPEPTPHVDPRCQAITDIIESVARQETALAHILDAESEKLLKVIHSNSSSTEHLMKINKSVDQTIRSITQLELILQSKLALFRDCLCVCDQDDEDDHDDWEPSDKVEA